MHTLYLAKLACLILYVELAKTDPRHHLKGLVNLGKAESVYAFLISDLPV